MKLFYVVTKTNWAASRWTPCAGPFATRAEAEAEAARWRRGGDIADERHAKVVSRTWLARHGYPKVVVGEARIVEDIAYNRAKPDAPTAE